MIQIVSFIGFFFICMQKRDNLNQAKLSELFILNQATAPISYKQMKIKNGMVGLPTVA